MGIEQCYFFEKREKPEWPEKTSGSRLKNQQQTQRKYNAESMNRTRMKEASALTTSPTLLLHESIKKIE